MSWSVAGPTVAVLGFTGMVLGLAIAYQFYQARQKREMFEAALAAGQADVASKLISTSWVTVVLRVLAVGIAVIVLLVVVPCLSGVYVALARGPDAARAAACREAVEKITGAPLGTMEVMIGGHRAYGCLSGNTWGSQNCGSPYDGRIRFSTVAPGFLNVFYVPDLREYYVFGKARVDPSGRLIENGTISAAEAMGPVKCETTTQP